MKTLKEIRQVALYMGQHKNDLALREEEWRLRYDIWRMCCFAELSGRITPVDMAEYQLVNPMNDNDGNSI